MQWRGHETFAVTLLVVMAWRGSFACAQQETADIRQVLDGRMRPDTEVRTFEHSERLYPSVVVARGKSIRAIPTAAKQLHDVQFDSNGRHYDLFDYLAQNRVAGLLVVKDGKIVLEDYELGFDARSRWASFSMAKSVSSTLIGIALQRGVIASLDDPVGKYVPGLRGSAYESVSLRNVMRMASGVQWDETYTDPNSDCRKLTDAQLRHVPGASMAYMATLKSAAPQGTVWNYNSGEANIAGAVLEGATHELLAAYLSETLWSRLGMESDATWWTESPGGMGLSGVGLGATLRDYARFGLFVQNDGVIDGKRVVPERWFQETGTPQVIGGHAVDYGLLWWPASAGDAVQAGAFEAEGIFGQRLYINPSERLVIVVLSARPKPVSISGVSDNDFFAAVARALR